MEQVHVLWHGASFNRADANPVNIITATRLVINQTKVAEETKNFIQHHQVPSFLMAQKPREILLEVERDALRELKVDRDIIMVPADTRSSPSFPFTSIPEDLTIETVQLLLQSKYDEMVDHLGHAEVLQLLNFCFKTYFTFNSTIYMQVKGTPMGSPISRLMAKTALQHLESLFFQNHKPKLRARYVDDAFIVTEVDRVLTFNSLLKSIFPDIKLTMEEKDNNQLAFLDVPSARKI
ncbi:unnamed protein product [Schistocephalus solidus]|uniref:Reverse transcriptase domain-containing protein n=1 Tax=Schistocephalus solidus TaxID=70667 RepID=A0A183T0F2_SCHSO|nr:unnamed protein product [Schistocephalus solidus]